MTAATAVIGRCPDTRRLLAALEALFLHAHPAEATAPDDPPPWQPVVVTPVAPPDFESLYQEHRARIYRFCLSQVRNQADAEDLAAEVFARAFRAYDPARMREGVLPWLFTIARNAIVDHRRHAGRWTRLFERVARNDSAVASVEDVAGVRDDLRRALHAMEGLRRRDRQLLGLRCAAGLSFADIAATLGISEDAASVATHRAMSRLRALYGESR